MLFSRYPLVVGSDVNACQPISRQSQTDQRDGHARGCNAKDVRQRRIAKSSKHTFTFEAYAKGYIENEF